MTDSKPSPALCPVCQSDVVYSDGSTVTLMGYAVRVGHNHDDNCRISYYHCDKGHSWSERKQNTCPTCDWKGKAECFCHPLGVKIHAEK